MCRYSNQGLWVNGWIAVKQYVSGHSYADFVAGIFSVEFSHCRILQTLLVRLSCTLVDFNRLETLSNENLKILDILCANANWYDTKKTLLIFFLL